MDSRLFQTIINQMQSVFKGRKAGIIDEEGVVVACTDITLIGSSYADALAKAAPETDVLTSSDMCFRSIGGRSKTDFFVFCSGTDELAQNSVRILSISFSHLKQFHDEKYDKASFIKNILMDNVMAGDVHVRARTLHLNADCYRAAFLIRTRAEAFAAAEVLNNMFPDKAKHFVVTMNDTDVVLVKEIAESTTYADLKLCAQSILDMINTELLTTAQIGIGSIVTNIVEINRSYKDACVALDVGKVFDDEHAIISYNNLGIGRLIYQLPTKLCELFLKEVFKKGTLDILDDETITTIQKFFENNLNVSEASRQLFVHRNTLVYRLDKILKLTGLDLRHFDDAIVFKVAMMVNRYLTSDKATI